MTAVKYQAIYAKSDREAARRYRMLVEQWSGSHINQGKEQMEELVKEKHQNDKHGAKSSGRKEVYC